MKIAIVGAGIGGLAAAIGFRRFGHEVQIFEQAETFEPIGAGIQLSPNACQVLDAFGLMDSITKHAFEPENAIIRDLDSGALNLRTPLRSVCRQRYGQPYLHIHRADLLDALLQKNLSVGVELRLGNTIDSVDLENRCIGWNQGHQTSFDLLVGADGIHSSVRKHIVGSEAARFTGQVAWRALVAVEDLPAGLIEPDATVWRGKGKHLVTYYVDGGKSINIVAVEERRDWKLESWTQKEDKSLLLKAFEGSNPKILDLLDAVEETYLWALHDRMVPNNWFNREAVILGDACHPMLPFMAQGAAMALEDAFILSDEVGNGANLEKALRSFQNRRKARVKSVCAKSVSNAALFHKTRSFGGFAGSLKLGLGGMNPGLAYLELDRLYGHDVAP